MPANYHLHLSGANLASEPTWSQNAPGYLQAADVFVLPSVTECMNLALLEAMACGAAPLCTPVGAVRRRCSWNLDACYFC